MRILFVSLFVVVIDQISKLLVKGISIPFLKLDFPGMYAGQKIPLLGNFFDITFVENPGIAFGIDFGERFKFFISLITLAASIGLLIYLYKNKNKLFGFRLSLALILGGAVGNLIDRIFYGAFYGYDSLFQGSVVDFFNLRFFNFFILDRMFGSYVFNVADMAVTCGVMLLLYTFNRQKALDNAAAAEIENYLAENKE